MKDARSKNATCLWAPRMFVQSARRLMGVAVALAVACALTNGVAACTEKTKNPCNEETVVDTEVMAFLSKARAHHHEATVQEESGKPEDAINTLSRLVSERRPHEGSRVPEVEEVLADTYARMAELELTRGTLDAAKTATAQGLTHAADPSYFRGHLLEVQGLVEEARSKKFQAAGNLEGAVKARESAIKLLEEAISIQDHVIAKRLGDGGRP